MVLLSWSPRWEQDPAAVIAILYVGSALIC